MPTRTEQPYRFFRAAVRDVVDVTPSFRRFTFIGDDLHDYGDPGFDQRIKVVFPRHDRPLETMPQGDDWYTVWKAQDERLRLPFRTYTTRAVRRSPATEVDIDMVAHEIAGPASEWIARASPGDEVLILAPTTDLTGVSLGVDFVAPARTDGILLAGDETAAPAIAAILERLPDDARGIVVLEVPDEKDADYLPRHPGFEYRVAGRRGEPRHGHLVAATRTAAADLVPPGRGSEVEEIDVDHGILWEVPRTAKGGAALRSAPLYAWLAGEAGAITALRRHLVTEHGVDRRAVAFMGYWRMGRAEN